MKKKLLYVVSTLRQCGPINQLFGIVTNLDKEQFEFKVLTLSPEPINTKKEDFVQAGIPLESLNLSRMEFQLKGKKVLKEYIKNYNPDIIHTTGVRVDTTVAKLGFGDRQVMSIRNYAYEDYVSKFGNLLGTYFAKDTIKAIDQVKSPVCCSYALEDLYKAHVKGDLTVVQNGVDVEKFKPLREPEQKLLLREKLGLDKDKTIFIAVGSLIDRKDPLTIIRAFKDAKINQAVLVMLGDGKLKEECQAEASDVVLVKGNVSNVVDYLQASDVYISASYSEGLPNSVLEAGRTGVKVLLSDIPQHREIYMHGYPLPGLFEPGNKEKLTSLIENEWERKSKLELEFAQYIEEYFSTQVMSAGYMAIYSQL